MAYPLLGCCAEENCVNPSMKSLVEFTEMDGCEYHLPPLVEVAVPSSSRPPSAKAGVVLGVSFVHCAAVWVSPVDGSPTDCA